MLKVKKIEHYSYSLGDSIGRGYSSQVFRGRDDRTNKVVAVKVIDLKKLKDLNKALLRSEIDILRRVKHKNVLALIDVYSTVNNCYIITQYCQQGDLESYIKRHGNYLKMQVALPFLKDVINGLSALAEHHIIHRDIKPANVLLSGGVAKLADFGFAKISEEGVTQNFSIGTPMYMPPQALQQNRYCRKHDIWSFGVLMYEILAGRTPFRANSVIELNEMIRKPVLFSPLIPQQCKAVIESCLKEEPLRISIKELSAHTIFLPEENKAKQVWNNQDRFEKTLPKRQWSSTNQLQTVQFHKTAQGFKSAPSQLTVKQIIGKVNFCRFVYKVIKLIQNAGLTVPSQFFILLKHKIHTIHQLLQTNPYHPLQYAKIKSIVAQYKERYDKLSQQKQLNPELLSIESELLVSKAYHSLNSQGLPFEYLNESQNKVALALDYTITLIQLQRLEDSKGEMKVDMGRLVQGKPVRVQFLHRQHIKKKMEHLDLL